MLNISATPEEQPDATDASLMAFQWGPQWGCGAWCVQFAVVDAKTGAVFMPSFYVAPRALVEGQTGEPEEPLQFRIDRKLLIVSGSRNEKGEGVYYYKWDSSRLTLIATVAAKKR